jgi:cation diffusion facilitator family transporter
MDSPKSEALEAAQMPPERSLRTGQGSALAGILVNGGLGFLKLGAGVLFGSYAVVADAAESFGDVLGSCVTLIGLRMAAEPADRNHPAGHGRAETLASSVTALAIAGIGVLIFLHAMGSLHVPRLAANPFALLVLVPVIVFKEIMFRWMRARGKEIGSLAVVADAWHQRSDVFVSFAALVGILVSWLGGKGWEHADSWAAMVAGVWLGGTGLWLLVPALDELMEAKVDPVLLEFITTSALECPGIRGVDKVWVRKLGMRLFVDLHIEVDSEISVREGHDLAHAVKSKLVRELPKVRDVMVHVEPYHPEREHRAHRRQPEALR